VETEARTESATPQLHVFQLSAATAAAAAAAASSRVTAAAAAAAAAAIAAAVFQSVRQQFLVQF
jgi:hypothetical protein